MENKREKIQKLKGKGFMPIRELAKITGVEKSTIHFYVSEGLLPKPVMVSRQVAYYPPETIDRIKLIKQLQKRFIPLKEIKKILKSKNIRENLEQMLKKIDSEILDEFLKNRLVAKTEGQLKLQEVKPEQEMKPEKVLPLKIVKNLKKIGVIKGEKNTFDREIISLIAEMREVGLDERNGFSTEFLKNYVDMCQKLVELEFIEFNSRVMRKLSTEKIIELAKVGIEKTSELIKIMHKKFLLEKLEELSRELNNRK